MISCIFEHDIDKISSVHISHKCLKLHCWIFLVDSYLSKLLNIVYTVKEIYFLISFAFSNSLLYVFLYVPAPKTERPFLTKKSPMLTVMYTKRYIRKNKSKFNNRNFCVTYLYYVRIPKYLLCSIMFV